jgi:hypothetical protein
MSPEEMNIVAFSEIMEVGQKEEKRSLLLNVLKDDLVDNASFIRSAMSDFRFGNHPLCRIRHHADQLQVAISDPIL